MAAPPLTHHEILELAAPFARRGRHVDLAASNRIDRRIAFKPLAHPPESALPELRESLELHSHGTGTCVLTRVLAPASGPQARLIAMGSRPDALLARIESVARDRQFCGGTGYFVARSYEVDPAGGLLLTGAVAQIDGLHVTMTLSAVRGSAAEITLLPTPAEALALPEDLLAVLGWDWARLIRTKEGWRTKLRLRGNLAGRSRKAEVAIERVASHLAQTLAEPPGRFHDRWVRARWGVVLRRAIPMLTFVALVATVIFMPHIAAAEGSELWMLLFQVPTALIALSFCLQELPTYEIPPLPRRSAQAGWRRSPEVTAGNVRRA